MMNRFARAEDGQALVVVAGAMVVLMGALGLALDWGHGYVIRRELQNGVDAATLSAARYVASSYTIGNNFEATVGDVCWDIRQRTSLTVELAFFSGASADDPSLWTKIATSDPNCAQGAGVTVPFDTRFVRAHASASYASLFTTVVGQRISVAASARAQLTAGAAVRPLHLPAGTTEQPGIGLSGATTLPNVAIWPIALHYRTGLLGTPCGQYCDASGRLVTLWQNNGRAIQDFGNFHQLISFAHESLHDPSAAHQLITESDYRGTSHGGQGHPATSPLRNASAQLCPNVPPGSWDSNGARTQTSAAQCDLPNWSYYGYGGSVSLGTRWSDPSWNGYRGGAAIPSALSPTRSSCTSVPRYFPVPSCGTASTRGDWVETINDPASSDISSNLAQRMREFVQRYGRDVRASVTQGWGKAVVVHVFLWDCAEHYDTSSGTWQLIEHISGVPQSCADITDADAQRASVDRIHMFTAVPFTFFENLINAAGPSVRINALWGDVFGEAGFYSDAGADVSCVSDPTQPACAVNPLMNSAFLVPDD